MLDIPLRFRLVFILCPMAKADGRSTAYKVYQVTCNICHSTYIGSTKRSRSHNRANERLYAAKRYDDSSAIAPNYSEQHPNYKLEVTFKELVRANDESSLRIKDAYHIDCLKSCHESKEGRQGHRLPSLAVHIYHQRGGFALLRIRSCVFKCLVLMFINASFHQYNAFLYPRLSPDK